MVRDDPASYVGRRIAIPVFLLSLFVKMRLDLSIVFFEPSFTSRIH